MDEKEYMLESVRSYNRQYKGKELANIITAMKIVDRKFFVPSSIKDSCYQDTALPIGHGQTISQPSTVARMLLVAELRQGLDVLEVGAGSGWNACLIQYLVYPGRVFAIERIFWLTKNAKNNLARLKKYLEKENSSDLKRFKNLIFETDDALDESSEIWQKKYDRIIITAGIPLDIEIEKTIQRMADRLLKKDSILICPQVSGPIKLYKKDKELKLEETQEDYVFVPLLHGRE